MPFVKAVIERSPAVKKLDLNRPDPTVSKSPDVATIPLKDSPVPYAPRARSAVDARLADIERLLHKIATVVVKQPGSTVLHDKLRNEASFLRKMKRQAYRPPPPPPSKPLPLTVRRTKKQRKVRQRELRALADPTLDNLEDLGFIFDEPEARRNRKRTRNPDAPDAVTDLPLHDVEFVLRDDTGPPEPAPRRRTLRGRRRQRASTPYVAMTTRSQKRKRRA